MRERIILAPGARNSELIGSLALHGVNCIGLKIMNAGELAEYTLMRSGISVREDFLSGKEERTVIAKAVSGIPYFGNPTYSDIREITHAVKRMRCLVTEEPEEAVIETALEKGLFTEKNRALLTVYRNYMALLKQLHAADSVLLIRKAIAEGKPVDADFASLKEYPLTPLEAALLSHVSSGAAETVGISSLYRAEGKPLQVEHYRNCYGASNEVETILQDIYAHKQLDHCTVAVTDPAAYSQLFLDYALLHDLPVTFGCGVPILNSNPAKLLTLYGAWMTGGFYGRDALTAMLESRAFDRAAWKEQFPDTPEAFSWRTFYEVLGGLRLTEDAAVNAQRISDYRRAMAEEKTIVRPTDEKAYRDFCRREQCLPFLEIASRELSLPAEEFIRKYAYIRRGSAGREALLMKLDVSAVSAIYDELGVIRRTGTAMSVGDLISNALKLMVCGERSEPGRLHITDIGGALTSVRDHLYIAGLSASKFPGSPRENYLLLDDDIRLFGAGSGYLTSDGRIRKKREQLLSLAHLASDLGSTVNVSYAGLNVSELKKDNASSLIFELCREEAGRSISSQELSERVEKTGYFDPDISVTRGIGRAYNEGTEIPVPPADFFLDREVSADTDREWSPSAIQEAGTEPYKFMLEYLLNIPQPKEENPYDAITPIAAGNVAHALMERLANADMSRDAFLTSSGEYFDRYVTENRPLIPEKLPEARTEFLEMMGNAYDGDPHRQVVIKEEDLHCLHPSGVRLRGLPDRVELLPDGSCLIVDFKTGREIKHNPDDIETCLQAVIYAYLVEQQGYRVSGAEFRYLRSGEIIPCRYDEEMKQALNGILIRFREQLAAFNFAPVIPETDDTADEE